MAPRNSAAIRGASRKPVKPPPHHDRYKKRRDAKKVARGAQALATVPSENALTIELAITQPVPTSKTRAKKSKVDNMAKRVYKPKFPPRQPILQEHAYGADLRIGEGRLRRRENWEARRLHEFRKLLPNEATPIKGSEDAVNWRCYAERNDEAKYHHQVVVTGTPGLLQIAGKKISWSASALEGKGGAGVRDAPKDISFEVDEDTLLHRRFVNELIVLRIQCGKLYTSNGEPGLDYETYTMIISNQHDARSAVNIINWYRKLKVDASLDPAVKELANLPKSEDEEDPLGQDDSLDQKVCHDYDTDKDSAVVDLVKSKLLRRRLDTIFQQATKGADLADKYILKRYMDEEKVELEKLGQWESPSETVLKEWEAPRDEEPMPKRYDQGSMTIN